VGLGFFFWRAWTRTAAPLKPIHLFGERKPIARDQFECLFDARFGCLCRALLRLDCATAILFSPRIHLIACPTVKPVALVADAIKDCSRRGGLVLDPFCGSGTILIAAERTGRKARALEVDPTYVDVGVRRWQSYTGKNAVLAASGETFETIEEQRAAKPAAA